MASRAITTIVRGIALGAAVLGAHPASAADKPLAADEGYLVLPIYTDRDIPRIEFVNRKGSDVALRKVTKGRQLALLRADAGTYDLLEVNLGDGWRIKIRDVDDAPVTLTVVAGAISYSGDLEMDKRGFSTHFKFGGCNVDVLPALAAAEPGLDLTVFDRYPVASKAKGCAPLVGDGPDTRPAAAWREATRRLPDAAELVTLNKILARHGKPPLALGQPIKDAWASLEDLATERIRRYRDDDEAPSVMWVRLEGLWGWRGHGASFQFSVQDGKLAELFLREFVYGGHYTHPDPDLRKDVEDYADGR